MAPVVTPSAYTWTLLFGYRTVKDVPLCPCGDPGNYMMMERSVADPLVVRFSCWCGRTMNATMDDVDELREFLRKHNVELEDDEREPDYEQMADEHSGSHLRGED